MRNDSLDQQINDYLLTATGHLQAHKTEVDIKKIIAYGTGAGSALALIGSAEAAVQYSNTINQTISITPGSTSTNRTMQIDLDNNGVPDHTASLAFEVSSSAGETTTTWKQGWADLGPEENVVLNAESNRNLRRFGAGALIGANPASSFGATGWQNLKLATSTLSAGNPVSTASEGTWTSDVSGFAGVRFQRNGRTHYGWIQLRYTRDGLFPDSMTVVDWAWETCPNTPITTGATSGGTSCGGATAVPADDPAFLGLSVLATGALGLGALRRRRKQQASLH